MDPIPLLPNSRSVFSVHFQYTSKFTRRWVVHELSPVKFQAANIFIAHKDVNMRRFERIFPRVNDKLVLTFFRDCWHDAPALIDAIMYQKRYIVKFKSLAQQTLQAAPRTIPIKLIMVGMFPIYSVF
jgi:hypothetical protein